MLICYILEIAKIDVEIASVLQKKPVAKRDEYTKDLSKKKSGKIKKANCSMVYQQRDGSKFQKCMFILKDKHLYSTVPLNNMMGLVEASKVNTVADQKYFTNMIQCYLMVRKHSS